jgi:Pretoxin HINT domain
MADGSERPIERIEIGQSVLSFDLEQQQLVAATVTGRLVHPDTESLVVLDGTLVTTPEHRFYVQGDWLAAGHLQPDSELLRLTPHSTTLSAAKLTSATSKQGPITTYNLQIQGPQNYFAAGYLVHNLKLEPVATPLITPIN